MRWTVRCVQLVLAAVFVIGGCAPRPERHGPSGELEWAIAVRGAGTGLTLSDHRGSLVLQIACQREPPIMRVLVPGFEPISSEDRLSFGVDGEPFVFVAQLEADMPSGVLAEAPIDPALLARWMRPQSVTAVYGAQTAGPYAPPSLDMSIEFAHACRQIAGEIR